MDKITFGKRLQKYREEAGYSQEKLAEKTKHSSIFISYMERGQKAPSVDTLIQLANALNISIDLLLGTEIQNSNTSRLLYLEEKMCHLPLMNQQRIMDIFDSIINIELMHSKDNRGGA